MLLFVDTTKSSIMKSLRINTLLSGKPYLSNWNWDGSTQSRQKNLGSGACEHAVGWGGLLGVKYV